jgi:hypothetical protein
MRFEKITLVTAGVSVRNVTLQIYWRRLLGNVIAKSQRISSAFKDIFPSFLFPGLKGVGLREDTWKYSIHKITSEYSMIKLRRLVIFTDRSLSIGINQLRKRRRALIVYVIYNQTNTQYRNAFSSTYTEHGTSHCLFQMMNDIRNS